MDTTPAETPRCTACHHTLPAWDLPRVVCAACQQRTADQLAELPALYAALDPAPGRGAPLVGTLYRAPGGTEPVRLDVVDLTSAHAGVLPLLDTWARDWAHVGGAELPARWGSDQRTPAEALCAWLRWHLDWACRRHPAADDFVREIAAAWHTVRAAATGDRGERRIPVTCPCGALLRVTVSTPGTRCPGCGTQYGRAQVLSLPLAQRSAA